MRVKDSKKLQLRKKSFEKAYKSLPKQIKSAIKEEIMAILDVETSASFYNHLYGKVPNTPIEEREIEKVFKRLGYNNIWEK